MHGETLKFTILAAPCGVVARSVIRNLYKFISISKLCNTGNKFQTSAANAIIHEICCSHRQHAVQLVLQL